MIFSTIAVMNVLMNMLSSLKRYQTTVLNCLDLFADHLCNSCGISNLVSTVPRYIVMYKNTTKTVEATTTTMLRCQNKAVICSQYKTSLHINCQSVTQNLQIKATAWKIKIFNKSCLRRQKKTFLSEHFSVQNYVIVTPFYLQELFPSAVAEFRNTKIDRCTALLSHKQT